MKAIKALLNELGRCDVINDFKESLSYNGIYLVESSEAFQKRLHQLYERALTEIPFLDGEAKKGLINIISKYVEQQEDFNTPSLSTIEVMNSEIEAGNTNPSLKKEYDFVKMIFECVSLQKFYLKL